MKVFLGRRFESEGLERLTFQDRKAIAAQQQNAKSAQTLGTKNAGLKLQQGYCFAGTCMSMYFSRCLQNQAKIQGKHP